MNCKQNQTLNKLLDLKPNKRGFISGRKVIKCLLDVSRANGNPMGTRIKELRTKLKISQKFVAKKMHWSNSKISRVERGFSVISIEEAKELSKILQTTPEFIVVGKSN